MKSWKNRNIGEETPFIRLSIFKIRLPFLHHRFEWPDYFQGLLMCAVDLAAIPLLMDILGMPFEVAVSVVILNGLLYLTHSFLGDPVVPGWITPAIPIIILYVENYEPGEDRIKALMSFQFMLGFLSIFLGMSKLAKKIIKFIPASIKSGVIVGAGISAIYTVFKDGGQFDSFPVTIFFAVGLAFYLIYSNHFSSLSKKNKIAHYIKNLGIFPIIIISVFVAPIFGESSLPNIEFGFTKVDFSSLINNFTIFGLGFPSLNMFIKALPTVFATYIVLFGDVLQSEALINEAKSHREDEKIDYDSNRAHLIFGGRNTFMSFFGPDITMCGPMWAAMHVVIIERFKLGIKSMNSIIGGNSSFRLGTNTGLLLLPIVSFVKPILGVALALTLIIQGFVSVRIGFKEAKSDSDIGIAGVIAAVLITKGAAWAFFVGIILVILLYGKDFLK